MTPDQFPLLKAAARSSQRFSEAVFAVARGIEEGMIRQTTLTAAKQTLSGAVYDGWLQYIKEPFFHGGKGQLQPLDVQELDDLLWVSGLHDVLAANRRLGRTKATGPAVDAMRAFVNEVLPLAEAVASLKGKVVKGRGPGVGAPRPLNPNKVVKTCPVCFRSIAVMRAKMAHHGYERPGTGRQTQSCPGIRFQPLEVSPDGLAWLVDALRADLAMLRKAYAERDGKSSMLVQKARGSETITRESALWLTHFARYVSDLEGKIAALERELPQLENQLRDWKPEPRAEGMKP